MCWMCGKVRPTDGPIDRRLVSDELAYKVDDTIYEANEGGDWEFGLTEFPPFGSYFFTQRKATSADQTVFEWNIANPVIWRCCECKHEVSVVGDGAPPAQCNNPDCESRNWAVSGYTPVAK